MVKFEELMPILRSGAKVTAINSFGIEYNVELYRVDFDPENDMVKLSREGKSFRPTYPRYVRFPKVIIENA